MKLFLIFIAVNIVGELIFFMFCGIGGIIGSHADSGEKIKEPSNQDYAELQEKYMELQKKYAELKSRLDADLTDESKHELT